MADNCLKFLKTAGGGVKLALWSHNYHIYHSCDLDNQGNFLKDKLGKNYFALISLFNEGKFNAFLWDRKTERTKGFKTFNFQAAGAGTYEQVFAETKWPLAIFDIQKAAEQAITKKELLKKYTVREVGSVFTPDEPETFQVQYCLFKECEAIIWVNTVTASTSLWRSNK
jgi:erythromycin esterase-like protein